MYMHIAQKGREARLNRNPKILAVAGKGGVGKTSLSAAFVRLLTETHPDARILAIDADPAVGLSTALGVEVRQTLDDIRKQIVSSVEDGEPRCLSAAGNFLPPGSAGGEPRAVNTVAVTPLTVVRANGKTWLESLTKIIRIP